MYHSSLLVINWANIFAYVLEFVIFSPQSLECLMLEFCLSVSCLFVFVNTNKCLSFHLLNFVPF